MSRSDDKQSDSDELISRSDDIISCSDDILSLSDDMIRQGNEILNRISGFRTYLQKITITAIRILHINILEDENYI